MRPIDADKLKFTRVRIYHESTGCPGGWNAVVMSCAIKDAPTLDVAQIIEKLEEKVKRRDNLLETMGIHMPDNPPMRWEYMHRPWKTVTTSGVLRCPNCKGVFHRIVGVQYKCCPECGKRLTPREESE